MFKTKKNTLIEKLYLYYKVQHFFWDLPMHIYKRHRSTLNGIWKGPQSGSPDGWLVGWHLNNPSVGSSSLLYPSSIVICWPFVMRRPSTKHRTVRRQPGQFILAKGDLLDIHSSESVRIYNIWQSIHKSKTKRSQAIRNRTHRPALSSTIYNYCTRGLRTPAHV